MLGDLQLPLVQEIKTLERRVLAEHKVPGMSGSLIQNLGRRPFRIALWGVATGEGAGAFVEQLDGKFREGRALPFTADIVADARLDQVVIHDLRVQELAGLPDRLAYVLTLREFIEVVEPDDASLLDADIIADAQGLMDDIVAGLDIGLEFLLGLEQFVPTLTDLLTRLEELGNNIGDAG